VERRDRRDPFLSGLILAVVALITVLPEYAVDIYYAFQAGRNPRSDYVGYAAANMTGANRLLIGFAWPLLVFLHWRRSGAKAIDLSPANSTELAFLLGASLYAFVILARGHIGITDTAILVALYALYLWRVSCQPRAEEGEDDEPGPASALKLLQPSMQWTFMGGLALFAAAVIVFSAEPFAEAMVDSGRRLGMDEFLLIQWLAPLASEAPAVTLVVLFVLAGRATNGLSTMISDKINQWTLLVGMLPLAVSAGAGSLASLPLSTRQDEEFFLTAAQSLFGLGLLLTLRLGTRGALALFVLFVAQLVLAFVLQDDPVQTVRALTAFGWVYIALAAVLFVVHAKRLVGILRNALGLESSAVNINH
jgi:cation:H+ antiporter